MKPLRWAKRLLSILYSITIGLSLIGSPLVVYADDYDYLPIGNFEFYNAYRFFNYYGYKLDYTNTIEYEEDLTGTFEYTGVLNGTLLGQENTSFTVSLSGELNTLEDGTYITGAETGNIMGGGSVSGTVFNLEINPVNSSQTVSGSMTCIAYNPVAHTYNNETGWNYDTYKCTDSHKINNPEYDVVLGRIALKTTNTTAYEIAISETESGGGSATGTISLNESASFSGSGGISLSGTTSTTGHKTYDIPSITYDAIDNSNKPKLYIPNNTEFCISVLVNTNSPSKTINILNSSNEIISTMDETAKNVGGFKLRTYTIQKLPNSINFRYIELPSDFDKFLIPLYVGFVDDMNDDLYRYIYGKDRTDDLLLNGTDQSQITENSINNTTNNFNYYSDEYHNIESGFNDDMNNSFSNIPTSSDLNNNNKFLNTANWVRIQFERLVLNTPFELLIVYSLILGIALVLIGKVR